MKQGPSVQRLKLSPIYRLRVTDLRSAKRRCFATLTGVLSPLVGLDLRQYRLTSDQTFRRPLGVAIVVFRYRRNVGRKLKPGLLRCRKYVYVGRQVHRLIEGAHTNEANDGTGTRVVTPNRESTLRAAGDLLAFSALRRSVEDFRIHT